MSVIMRVKDAALLWNITERRVTSLCKEGKISGAAKDGKSWLIPVDAEKPIDRRTKSSEYMNEKRSLALPLPIGISDYCLS